MVELDGQEVMDDGTMAGGRAPNAASVVEYVITARSHIDHPQRNTRFSLSCFPLVTTSTYAFYQVHNVQNTSLVRITKELVLLQLYNHGSSYRGRNMDKIELTLHGSNISALNVVFEPFNLFLELVKRDKFVLCTRL